MDTRPAHKMSREELDACKYLFGAGSDDEDHSQPFVFTPPAQPNSDSLAEVTIGKLSRRVQLLNLELEAARNALVLAQDEIYVLKKRLEQTGDNGFVWAHTDG